MRVVNTHWRDFASSQASVGALIDTLASADDRLWPNRWWPRMRLDRPLGIDASGGHGPVRYNVRDHLPQCSVRFVFSAPKGFDGFHEFVALESRGGGTRLLHHMEMVPRGPARLTWPLFYRPMHNALIEDALHTAAISLGEPSTRPRWSSWVRVLRKLASISRHSAPGV